MRISVLLLIALFFHFNVNAQSDEQKKLYETIARLDSIFFHAYNTCDLKTQAEYFSDSIEFYHDRTGLDTSKSHIMENTKKYICGKIRRELVKGSLEVSPLPGYGAVELGSHMFHNNQDKTHVPRPSKFLIIWKNTNGNWKITRVISLH